jgi:hypothetical protein
MRKRWSLSVCALIACGGGGSRAPDSGLTADAAGDASTNGARTLAPMSGKQVAIDGDQVVFWSDSVLWQVKLDGTALAKLTQGDDDSAAFAVGPQEIAWVDVGHHVSDFRDGRIRAVSRTGGTARTLAGPITFPNDIAMFDGRLCWGEIDGERVVTTDLEGLDPFVLSSQGEHANVAVDAAGVVWTENGITTGRVLILRPGATAPEQIADGQNNKGNLVLNGNDLYWMTYRFDTDETTVMHADVSTKHVDELAHEPMAAESLAADATSIYLVDHDAVLRAPRTGGSFSPLATNQAGAFGIAVAGHTLVWTTSSAVQALEL